MSPLAYAALAFLVVAGLTFLAAAVPLQRWAGVRRERLMPATSPAAPVSILRWDEQAGAAWQRSLERLGRALGPRQGPGLSRYRERLAWAGYQSPQAVPLFVGAKLAAAIACGLAYPLYGLAVQRVLPQPLAVSLILLAGAFFLGDLWLYTRIRGRRLAIVHALPDVLDLLMVCVEAGMAFDAAVARVAQQPQVRRSPLHEELLRMHLEMRVGRRRDEALRGLAARTGVPEVKAMVGAFIQTDRLGTSLGKTLRVHAESARVARRHRAEERAYLAPLKMIFPTVLFLMPSFFLVALAPGLLKLLEAFQTLAGR
ncbi:MAG: type II secretion system F family protein [Candidatus Rokuibacteriota bacterium]